MHRQLADAAAAWQADERDDAGLYRGVRLHAARDWAAAHPGDANPLETDFLATSEAVEEQTVRRAVRTARRLRALAAGLLVLLVAAAVAGVVAVQQRSTARRQALQADANRLATLASTLPADQRDLALLLGAQAYQLRAADDTAGGLQTALVQTPPGLDRVIRYRSASTLPHLDTHRSPVGGARRGRHRHHRRPHHRPRAFAPSPGLPRASSPCSVATTSSSPPVDPTGTSRSGTSPPDGYPGSRCGTARGIVHAVFDPHDNTGLWVISDHGLSMWDRHDPQHPRRARQPRRHRHRPGQRTEPDDQPRRGTDRRRRPCSSAAKAGARRCGTPAPASHCSAHSPARWDPSPATDGRSHSGYGGDTVLMNAETGQLEATVSNTGGAPLAILSPDRRRIAVSEQVGTASVVVVYDLTTKRPVGTPLRLHGTTAYPVGFLPDGRLVTSSHNEAAIWTLGKTLSPLATEVNTEQDPDLVGLDSPRRPYFCPEQPTPSSPDSDLGFFASPLQLHDAASGQLTGTLFNGAVEGTVAASPDGRLIAAGSQDRGVGIWNLQTGKRIARLTGVPGGYDLSWSPAGNLVAADTLTAVQLWNVSDPNHPRLFTSIRTATPTSMDYLLFSADGRRLVTTADQTGTI